MVIDYNCWLNILTFLLCKYCQDSVIRMIIVSVYSNDSN